MKRKQQLWKEQNMSRKNSRVRQTTRHHSCEAPVIHKLNSSSCSNSHLKHSNFALFDHEKKNINIINDKVEEENCIDDVNQEESTVPHLLGGEPHSVANVGEQIVKNLKNDLANEKTPACSRSDQVKFLQLEQSMRNIFKTDKSKIESSNYFKRTCNMDKSKEKRRSSVTIGNDGDAKQVKQQVCPRTRSDHKLLQLEYSLQTIFKTDKSKMESYNKKKMNMEKSTSSKSMLRENNGNINMLKSKGEIPQRRRSDSRFNMIESMTKREKSKDAEIRPKNVHNLSLIREIEIVKKEKSRRSKSHDSNKKNILKHKKEKETLTLQVENETHAN